MILSTTNVNLTLPHLSDRWRFWFYHVHLWSLFGWQQLTSRFWWWNRESTSGELKDIKNKAKLKPFKYLYTVFKSCFKDMLCVCLHLCFFTLTSRPEFLRGDKQQLSQGFVSFCASSADMERTQWPSQPCQRHCLFFYLLYYSQCLHGSMYDGFKEVQWPELKLLISCCTSFYSYSHQNSQID